jgi:hypothetical protein
MKKTSPPITTEPTVNLRTALVLPIPKVASCLEYLHGWRPNARATLRR